MQPAGGDVRQAHTVETVRAAEQALMARLPHGTLMRRAATGLAAVCARVLPRVSGARVVLLVGSGDNGGDALYAGAFLARRGASVRAVPTGSRIHEEGLAALRAAGGRTVAADTAGDVLASAGLIVDGLLGIGGRGGLSGSYADLAEAAAESPAPVVAVDLPSGIDADTGEVAGPAVRADLTVTFGTHKPGLLIDPGAGHAGTVELVDIGLGPHLPDAAVLSPQSADIAALLPALGRQAHKYSRGVLGVAAGSDRYPGAAVLSVGGALRAGGAGMVRFAGPEGARAAVLHRWPEVVAGPEAPGPGGEGGPRAAAWMAGPGRGTGSEERAELARILDTGLPVVLDADALTILAGEPALVRGRGAPTLLTPHAGELARLLPDLSRAAAQERRLDAASAAAEAFGCTVLLKGSTTVIAEPGRAAVANPTGTPLLATAGSGDVLSGMIGSFLAGGLAPREAAMCGAYLHGLAARLAAGGAALSASDLFDGIPSALRALAALDAPARG